ncbi:MAG: hypothetical protein M3065_15660 [Actinomycetota bacterium]|nr:hypothetical protein [Actinomycetota bacterium]
MKRMLLVYVTMAVLLVPAVLVGKALHFGGLAYMAVLVVVMLIATALVDREAFYGPRLHRR